MSNEGEPRAPETQPSFSGRPPSPPKITARDIEDQPDDPAKTIYLLEPVLVKDLASALRLKPFKVVADLMELKLLKVADDFVDFETASIIARKHGCRAQRPPPGMLVL
jgi:translation initiation factor IF-2